LLLGVDDVELRSTTSLSPNRLKFCAVDLVQDKDTHVEGECEFLFVPYSAFTVESVTWSVTPQDHSTPHRVTLAAAVDNTACPEDAPLAPWC
jgi:hypothetical protein